MSKNREAGKVSQASEVYRSSTVVCSGVVTGSVVYSWRWSRGVHGGCGDVRVAQHSVVAKTGG